MAIRYLEADKVTLPAKAATCYICSSDRFVDDHHIDCCEGKLSLETVPLCRRCHRTYHDLGVEWFEDEYLDKAIELENRHRQIVYDSLKSPTRPLELLSREDIRRSDYFNKTHGLPETKETKGSRTPAFTFHLPRGEPLCGSQWVNDHMYDLLDWVPRIEIIHPDFHLTADIDSEKKLMDVVKAIRGLKEHISARGSRCRDEE